MTGAELVDLQSNGLSASQARLVVELLAENEGKTKLKVQSDIVRSFTTSAMLYFIFLNSSHIHQ